MEPWDEEGDTQSVITQEGEVTLGTEMGNIILFTCYVQTALGKTLL